MTVPLGTITPVLSPLTLWVPLLQSLQETPTGHQIICDRILRALRLDQSETPDVIRNATKAFTFGVKMGFTSPGEDSDHWRLTEKGLHFVQELSTVEAPSEPLPPPGAFIESFLKVLGRLSNHTANLSFTSAEITTATLIEFGVDPDNLPSTWSCRSANGVSKVAERIRWTAINQSRSANPTVAKGGHGRWMLTPFGVDAALKLNGTLQEGLQEPEPVEVAPEPVEEPKAPEPVEEAPERPSKSPNMTAVWMGKHMHPKGKLYQMMRRSLSKRLPISATTDQIEDHIQTFVMRAIRRDSFAKVLSTGKTIPYSKVVSYCVNSGRTDVRNMGTDPVCRTLYGAQTEKERRDRPLCVVADPPRDTDTDGNIITGTTSLDEAALDFERIWKQIEDTVEERKPGAWQRYASLLLMQYQGFSRKEIADRQGVSPNRAASMVAESRRLMREARRLGDFEEFGL